MATSYRRVVRHVEPARRLRTTLPLAAGVLMSATFWIGLVVVARMV